VVLPPRPARLVSLVPNLTETLWWWHLADRVVGRTEWCTAPPGAFRAAREVRGTKNPDVRAIVELAPDVVIANEEENRELDVRRLRDAGVPVWVTRVRTLADAAASLRHLAAGLGVPAAGEDLATAFARLEATRPAAPTLTACVPIWRGLPPERSAATGDGDAEVGSGPADDGWMAVGAATVSADVLAAAGFAVWPGGAAARYPTVDRSAIVAADLDVVLLTDEPYRFTRADAADLPGHRVRHVDGTGLFWWGPRTPTVVADLRRLARHLQRRRVTSQRTCRVPSRSTS
jgi:ABC-type hemin transport system substrate-binding protein